MTLPWENSSAKASEWSLSQKGVSGDCRLEQLRQR